MRIPELGLSLWCDRVYRCDCKFKVMVCLFIENQMKSPFLRIRWKIGKVGEGLVIRDVLIGKVVMVLN